MSDDLTTEEYYDQEAQAQEEAYFHHTLGDFESFVKEMGATYVLSHLSDEVRDQLEVAFTKC